MPLLAHLWSSWTPRAPLDDDAGVPDALEVVPEEQPGEALRDAVGDVVHPEGDLEPLSAQHDIQEIVVAKHLILIHDLL